MVPQLLIRICDAGMRVPLKVNLPITVTVENSVTS